MLPTPEHPSNTSASPGKNETDRERHFRLSRDLLCIAGADGYFRQVNPSWTRVLGWSEAELLARPIEHFMHPDDRGYTLRARARMFEGVPVHGLENRYRCKDGSYRWLSWQSSVEPGGDTVFAIARDVTERRLVDHERLVLSKLESTSILAGGMAHDFNNLLASLLLNLEMVGLAGPTNARQDHHLKQANNIILSARALTQQLLTFAQSDLATRRVIDLAVLLRQSLDLVLHGTNCRGELTVAPDLWPVEVDESQISEAVRQLIINSREAMPSGGTVRLHADNIEHLAGQGLDLLPGRYVRLRVSDEGTGMPADLQTRVFDPYFSTKQRGVQKGMGLGLTICHSIFQKHGGAIVFDPAAGSGTTLICHLPAAAPRDAAPPSAPETPEGRSDAGPHAAKILVMDDEPGLREILRQTLVCLGFQVEIAEDGDTALALYEREKNRGVPFSAVMLDLTMRGGKGGVEVASILRESDPLTRAILMTGYHQEEVFRHPARHGFKAALAKPFSIDGLRAILREVLGSLPAPQG